MSVLLAPRQDRIGAHGLSGPDAALWSRSGDPRPLRRRHRFCRGLLLRRLCGMGEGRLTLVDSDGRHLCGTGDREGRTEEKNATGPAAEIHIHDPRFYTAVVRGGGLGAAEAYLRGDWDADDLVTAMRVLLRNRPVLSAMEGRRRRWRRPFQWIAHQVRRNTLAGSRRNIAAHYDLNNDFFRLFLDPTMTYSAGIFSTPSCSMEEASVAKYERICRQLELNPSDHLLEIGCGWGGLAVHAATRYGCRVTATTISREQFDWTSRRIRELGLSDRVTLLMRDYRRLEGQYDKLASIEMIEAVGESYLDTFFSQCSRLLRPHGIMMLQAITMPEYRYDQYRRSVDFIQRYIFPGGFLPSIEAIGGSLRRATDLRLVHLEDFGLHYGETLRRWRAAFLDRIEEVRRLGFPDRFLRMWHYYLCFCEAGFDECWIGLAQMRLQKPSARLADLPATHNELPAGMVSHAVP